MERPKSGHQEVLEHLWGPPLHLGHWHCWQSITGCQQCPWNIAECQQHPWSRALAASAEHARQTWPWRQAKPREPYMCTILLCAGPLMNDEITLIFSLRFRIRKKKKGKESLLNQCYLDISTTIYLLAMCQGVCSQISSLSALPCMVENSFAQPPLTSS